MIGGELTMALAEATGARLLPVDSEHSALFQLIGAEPPGDRRAARPDRLGRALPRPHRPRRASRVEDALAHPTWRMGGRITIDSATLMNKGFEAIEAHHLFGVPYERIDGRRPPAVDRPLADRPQRRRHAGPPRLPRHAGADLLRAALPRARRRRRCRGSTWPRVGELTFEAPDLETFACLRLALEAGRAGGTAPCVLNAADEVAVAAFLDGRIGFTAIAAAIERVLEEMPAAPADPLRGPLRGRRRGPAPHRRAGRGVGAAYELGLRLPRLLAC